MAKETKVKDRNGEERIIKRSKLKIGIITLVILILLTLIGVGIYFIVQATKSYDYDVDWNEADITEVREDILDGDGSNVAIYFYEEDGQTSNFLLRDDTVYENGEDGLGALSEIINTTGDDITWYGVEITGENELLEELLTVEAGDFDNEGYILDSNFEYLGAGTALRDDMWMLSNLSHESTTGNDDYEVDTDKITSFSMQVQNNWIDGELDEDNERDIIFTDSSTDGGDGTTDGGDGTTEASRKQSRSTGTPLSVEDGTTMFFNGDQLTTMVKTWTTVDVDEEEEDGTTSDLRDDYHDTYKSWLEEIIKHNNEFWS